MRLPAQSPAVDRGFAASARDEGVLPSRRQVITGMATCKRGNNLLFTGSATVCAEPTHDNCTAAKQAAVNSITAACTAQGGIPRQSGSTCSYGDRC